MKDKTIKFHNHDRLPDSEEVIEKLAGLMLLQDWLKIWGSLHPLSLKDQAIINTYEASDVLKSALYDSQGRRKINRDHFITELGDLIIMSMMTAVRSNMDIFQCLKMAIQRLENVEYKKSGAKN